MKTNKYWYQYIEHGCYYKLINEVLMFSPMLANGDREIDDGAEVDFEMLKGEPVYPELKQIEKDLQGLE